MSLWNLERARSKVYGSWAAVSNSFTTSISTSTSSSSCHVPLVCGTGKHSAFVQSVQLIIIISSFKPYNIFLMLALELIHLNRLTSYSITVRICIRILFMFSIYFYYHLYIQLSFCKISCSIPIHSRSSTATNWPREYQNLKNDSLFE